MSGEVFGKFSGDGGDHRWSLMREGSEDLINVGNAAALGCREPVALCYLVPVVVTIFPPNSHGHGGASSGNLSLAVPENGVSGEDIVKGS